MGADGHKRYRLWIDSRLQLRYITFNVVFLLVFAIIISGGIYLGIWRSVTNEFSDVQLYEDLKTVARMREYESVRTRQAIDVIPFLREESKMLSQHQRKVLNNIIIRTNKKLVPLFFGLFLFVILSSLVLSHRLAGPIYRFKQNMARISKGELMGHFVLRQKDELKDLALEIETSVNNFAKTVDNVKNYVAEIRKSKSDPERANYLNEIEKELAKYKTKSDK